MGTGDCESADGSTDKAKNCCKLIRKKAAASGITKK